MRKTVICLAVVSLLALGGPAIAELCTIDAVPASTLLVPNFRVELNDPQGLTTLFSVNNASAAPVLAHVTLWTDWSIPTIDFDVYLTGFDVQTFNLRDIFTTGTLPTTAPDSDISNLGDFSTGHFGDPGNPPLPASCENRLPVGDLLPSQLALVQDAHTGQQVEFPGQPGDECWGETYPDSPDVARGYITVDYVEQCSVDFPNTDGYFTETAGFENVLWGDYFYVDPGNDFAQGETAVHIEAGTVIDGVCQEFGLGDYTFYGRYPEQGTTPTFAGIDCREPLGTTYASRYLTGGAFDGGTSLVCWRDSKTDPSPVVCGTGRPDEVGFAQQQVVVFDEEENPDIVDPGSVPSPVPQGEENVICPIETQVVEVGSDIFPAAFNNGWTYLNLNHSLNDLIAVNDPDGIAQAWVTTIMDAEERYSVGFDAIQLDSACDAACFEIGEGGAITPCDVAPQ